MRVGKTLVIGANGGIGHRLVRAMEAAAAGEVRAMARPGRVSEALRDTGAQIVEGDLLGDLDAVLDGVDAVVFCAGSGGGTGLDRTLMVDLWGAVRAIEACEAKSVQRFVMVSSIGVDDPRRGPEALQPYLAAKAGADAVLMRSRLDWAIVRPGRLTDDEPAGFVRFEADEEWPAISREDVAQSLHRILASPRWSRRVELLFGGSTGDIATRELASR